MSTPDHTYHPWHTLRDDHPTWDIMWHDLPHNVQAITCHTTQTILIDPRLTQAQRRCALTHEIVHIERGPVPAGQRLACREETAVETAAARRLITLPALIDALKTCTNLADAAEHLWVDIPMLQARINDLSPDEIRTIEGNTTNVCA